MRILLLIYFLTAAAMGLDQVTMQAPWGHLCSLQVAKSLNTEGDWLDMMLQVLDVLFFAVHCFVISFNLTGWIWTCTRRWHLASVGLTLFSWLAMGIWYGLGYCALTDWHWQVKRALGEANLPNSFLTYLINDVMGLGLEAGFINWGAGIILTVVIFLSLALNFRDYWQYRLSHNLSGSNE